MFHGIGEPTRGTEYGRSRGFLRRRGPSLLAVAPEMSAGHGAAKAGPRSHGQLIIEFVAHITLARGGSIMVRREFLKKAALLTASGVTGGTGLREMGSRIVMESTLQEVPNWNARPAPATGPLRVHPTNPRYFTDGSGRAIFSRLAHVGQFSDIGSTRCHASTGPPISTCWSNTITTS
jgi:hypothetical protein